MPVRRLFAVLCLSIAASLEAQTAADTVRALNARMKSDLRNLVTAQEGHYAERASYAPSVAVLGAGWYRPSVDVSVELVNAGNNGYGAIARTAGRAGSCVININLPSDQWPRTDVERKAGPEGEPTCDGDGQTERAAFASVAQATAAGTLVRLAKHQERHFGRTGAYTADPSALTGLRIPPTITVTIELATSMGANPEPVFLATATDARYEGYSCVLASGWARFRSGATTLAEKKHAGGGSTAVCDTFK